MNIEKLEKIRTALASANQELLKGEFDGEIQTLTEVIEQARSSKTFSKTADEMNAIELSNALEEYGFGVSYGTLMCVAAELRRASREIERLQALAAPAQEPFGYLSQHTTPGPFEWQFSKTFSGVYRDTAKSITAVYTTPPAAVVNQQLTTEPAAPLQEPPPECQTEAEKRAYAFGWWKALEANRAAPVQEPTVEDNSQEWAGMDGATAWHLIRDERPAMSRYQTLSKHYEMPAMNEKTIEMAREAGFGGNPIMAMGQENLERFAALVAAAEREKVITDLIAMYGGPADPEAAIRARGQA